MGIQFANAALLMFVNLSQNKLVITVIPNAFRPAGTQVSLLFLMAGQFILHSHA
jgi:hypothetical protein